jgi:hypothetical protein
MRTTKRKIGRPKAIHVPERIIIYAPPGVTAVIAEYCRETGIEVASFLRTTLLNQLRDVAPLLLKERTTLAPSKRIVEPEDRARAA